MTKILIVDGEIEEIDYEFNDSDLDYMFGYISDTDGVCTIAELVEWTGRSEDYVTQTMNRLVVGGWLKVVKNGWKILAMDTLQASD
jgi:hypothetical protein